MCKQLNEGWLVFVKFSCCCCLMFSFIVVNVTVNITAKQLAEKTSVRKPLASGDYLPRAQVNMMFLSVLLAALFS